MKQPRIGIIGLGYWGPNWLRNFAAFDGCTVAYACDRDAERIKKYERMYPSVRFTQDYEGLLKDETLDAVVIATPPETHAPLARLALDHGKHVLLEKPMTVTADDAADLTVLAQKKNLVLLIDHTFVFTGAVEKIAGLVRAGDIGDVLYLSLIHISEPTRLRRSRMPSSA